VDCMGCWQAVTCIRGLESGIVAFSMRAVALGLITSVLELVTSCLIAPLRLMFQVQLAMSESNKM
jgi:hypothetical protein